jgi:membrane-bound lytic murein transglycosylase F
MAFILSNAPLDGSEMVKHLLRYLCYILLAMIIGGCGDEHSETPVQAPKQVAKPEIDENFIENGDLDKLKKRKQLRILVPSNLDGGGYLPRKGSPVNIQKEAARNFALSLGLEPLVVPVSDRRNTIQLLLEGKGDIIAGNLAITKERKRHIAFSVPVTYVSGQIVTRSGDTELREKEDLQGRTVAVDPASSFWSSIKGLQHKYPGVGVQALENSSVDDVLAKVADGLIDVAVLSSNDLERHLAYRDDLRVAFDVSKDHSIALGLRPDAHKLREALNQYLHEEQLTQRHGDTHLDDLAAIKKRKVLRVLLRNNAASYFLWRGELLGFEYELAKEFAKQHGLRLEVVVPPTHGGLLTWLQSGKGDIAAGFLAVDEIRSQLGIAFSRPYHYASELVVTRSGEREMSGPEDLANRTLVVRPSSAYWMTLDELRQGGGALDLKTAPENMETEDIIARVATGEYDLTVADGHILDIELTWRTDITAAFPLGEKVAHAWAVRPDNQELLAAINDFFKKEYRGVFYNLTYRKYFKNPRKIRAHAKYRLDKDEETALSPYDGLVRKYADQFGFDWRMVVAQMYQESRFNPEAKSWAGALGLMQVMPRTAKQMGIERLKDPETGLRAGMKYLNWLRDRFDPDLPVADRTWFVLAAYNAGIGHVQDARRLARSKGWDANRWFDNVEQSILLLSQREYATKAKHGYVRGREPVQYVREIRERYQAYLRLTEPARADPKL